MKKQIKSILALGLFFSVGPVKALTLQEYLSSVQKKHRGFQSFQVSKEAADDRQQAGDLELTPMLTLSGSFYEDKKLPNMLGATATKQNQFSFGIAKKWSTGTQLSVSASAVENENPGIQSPTTSALYSKYANGSLGFSASQSLWKNGFGDATRLRQSREGVVASLEKSGVDLQERQLLTEAEANYWDYLYLKEELKLRLASLERAKRIEAWVGRRVGDGIGDRADLLNAQALVASRKLQLLATQDELTAIQKKLKDHLELSEQEPLPELNGDINQNRDLKSLVEGNGAQVVRLDAYLSKLQAQAKKIGALEAEEALKADLTLGMSYKTNSYDSQGTAKDAFTNMTKTDTPTTALSLTWTYLWETDAKSSTIGAAKKDALAAQLQAERKLLESGSSWSEIQRRNSELSKKIEAAKIIARLQMDRAKAEQDKLSKGRSITSNVIQSEQDAEESELTLTKLNAEQRKLEAQARLFVGVQE